MAAPDAHPVDQLRCPSADSGLLPAELRAWMVLLGATGAVEQRLRSVVKETLDVSHDEFLILCLLAELPRTGLRMTQVADLLGRPKTRLTYQIACLQRAGLVRDCRDREVLESDRGLAGPRTSGRLRTELPRGPPRLAPAARSGSARPAEEGIPAIRLLAVQRAGFPRGPGRQGARAKPRRALKKTFYGR